MEAFFGGPSSSSRRYAELVRDTVEAMRGMATDADAVASVSRLMAEIKTVLYGVPEQPPDKEAGNELATEILSSKLLEIALACFPLLGEH